MTKTNITLAEFTQQLAARRATLPDAKIWADIASIFNNHGPNWCDPAFDWAGATQKCTANAVSFMRHHLAKPDDAARCHDAAMMALIARHLAIMAQTHSGSRTAVDDYLSAMASLNLTTAREGQAA